MPSPTPIRVLLALTLFTGAVCATNAHAQTAPQGNPAGRPAGQQPAPSQPTRPTTGVVVASTGISLPTDYVIGPDDVLSVLFWRDTDMSGDVTVRPDGMITLPLVRDIKAAGYTPDQLREQIQKAAAKFIEEPNVTVSVKQINSRNVFITGQVARPGAFSVSGQMTVLQLIALSGGLTEYANGKKISITRPGQSTIFRFNYNDVLNGKKLEQNIVLKPGDTVLVP